MCTNLREVRLADDQVSARALESAAQRGSLGLDQPEPPRGLPRPAA